MTAAESARDLLSAVTNPVSHSELAAHLLRDYSLELFDALTGLVLTHVEELGGMELSNVLWAYTTVGHRDMRLANAVAQSLLGKLSELGSAELANVLWALSRTGIYDPQFVLAVSERVWDALPSASPRQLAAILQAYAWFRQRDPELEEDEDLLRSIAAKVRAQVAAASATDLALALSCMARLRRADGALLAEACAALRREVATTPLPVLAEATWACALLQYRELTFLEAVAMRVAQAVQQVTELTPVPPAMASGVRSTLPLPLRQRNHGADRRGAWTSTEHIKPLEAESATAWGRLLRAREPAHKLPAYLLPAAFVAFQAEMDGRDDAPSGGHGGQGQHAALHLPGVALSRRALEAEVVAALRAMGLKLRPSSTVDGMLHMDHTMPINGLSICVEVLSAACCTAEPPHWPMGPAVCRLRSLVFRGWTPLVVPFSEWEALSAEETPSGPEVTQPAEGGKVVMAQQAAAAAQQRYLRRKLEELLGEELPPVQQLAPKRRMG
ncbi:hypothetical protein GPECTOR_38g306 [Gonium pectorale]|uniref:RAP domain-containing protein n=1 Tax=Gonium pectorale TaxID=33097 RepID=A0A150GB64_GONPE|nr:hypothetical protein GPECTOR_38g306 [Gonium pectorale]|eukprot:KXZ47069.1 hypothetical protein GPECTOR_38g306 [Gonium pectorale]